jgi:hypothetical protein
MTKQDEKAIEETTAAQKVAAPPWYSLNPRVLSHSRLLRGVLIGLVLASVSITSLWRLLWYYPVYSNRNFAGVTDAQGKRVEAWRWVEGKEIRIYALPGIKPALAKEAAAGVREMLHDTRLNLQVVICPASKEVLSAYQASLEKKDVNGQQTQCVSFDKLAAHLVELRGEQPHADVLIVDKPIAEYWWAHGMSVFSKGLVVLEVDSLDARLAKHESAHLLGYMMHDSFPLFVLGYPWEGWPTNRNTLMMLYSSSNDLSPRARDAIHSFWSGLEKRTGKKYLL